ncbi:sensor domain-containing diguanylate cyclase [Fusobacterium sp.]|uniref:sensor domain-containing diguanylate cyclase n=1 Tax=Fusobacterium sp. TaxID=68766 RepID=UPI0029042718|nr:sensor domain-containing diguanylate cyclase [Fusobacterium sp.]MDU1910661.1 sensor domain-containing diguanylate cyclase [Fusobacterium sp.]
MTLFSKKNNYYHINSNHQVKNNELEEVLTLAADGIGKFVLNEDLTVLYFNQGLCNLVGEKAENIEKNGFNSNFYVHPDDMERIKEEVEKILEANQKNFEMTYRLLHVLGHLVYVKVNGLIIEELYEDKYPILYLIFTNISSLMQMNHELEMEKKRYAMFIDLLLESYFEYDVKSDILKIYDNTNFYLFPDKEMRMFSKLIGDEKSPITIQNCNSLYKCILSLNNCGKDIELLIDNNEKNWFHVKYHQLFDSDNTINKIIGSYKNIHKEKIIELMQNEYNCELKKKAEYDIVTGLLNRATLEELISLNLKIDIMKGINVFMIFDVDNFKNINDSYGHPFGDIVLNKIAKIFKDSFRTVDVIGRLGGDEFAVFLPQIPSIEWITQKLKGILPKVKRLSKELNIEKPISVSIGIYEIKFSDSFKDIFLKADKALYQAKKSGKNRYEFYSK